MYVDACLDQFSFIMRNTPCRNIVHEQRARILVFLIVIWWTPYFLFILICPSILCGLRFYTASLQGS